ncbi:MAG: hypothetical protein NT067_03575 [Candidatus Diapherotrites archaeon]|nr:hypothetical protein [Candidatus Diapherotrites archaeon]
MAFFRRVPKGTTGERLLISKRGIVREQQPVKDKEAKKPNLIASARFGEARRVLAAQSIPAENIKQIGKTGILALKDKSGNLGLVVPEGSFVSNREVVGVVSRVRETQMVVTPRFALKYARLGKRYVSYEGKKITVKADAKGETGWFQVGILLK